MNQEQLFGKLESMDEEDVCCAIKDEIKELRKYIEEKKKNIKTLSNQYLTLTDANSSIYECERVTIWEIIDRINEIEDNINGLEDVGLEL